MQVKYPCPICGKPRKKAPVNANLQVNSDGYYKTCGRKSCFNKCKSIKSHKANEPAPKDPPRLYRGLSTAIENSKKTPQRVVKKYMSGFGKYIIVENVLKKKYREQQQEKAKECFDDLKRQAQEHLREIKNKSMKGTK